MAQWRGCNASNKPHTCLWCGKSLHPYPYPDIAAKRTNPDGSKPEWGQYGDNFFCGLRCGYLFGEAMAGFGRRLQPRATPTETTETKKEAQV